MRTFYIISPDYIAQHLVTIILCYYAKVLLKMHTLVMKAIKETTKQSAKYDIFKDWESNCNDFSNILSLEYSYEFYVLEH